MTDVSTRLEPPKARGHAVPKTKQELELEHSALNERLSKAAKKADFEEIRKCLKEGADVNTKTYTGRTPLWSAVYLDVGKSSEVIELLLDSGADLEQRDIDGETALWTATSKGNYEHIKLLLRRGANPNAKKKNGTSVLMEAYSRKDTKSFELLLEAGVDIEALDANGLTPLRRALEEQNIQFTNILLARYPKISKQMLFAAAKLGVESILKDLLSECEAEIEDKDENGLTVLWHVLASKNESCIDFVQSMHPEINVQGENGENMLHQAARFGNKRLVELLVRKRLFIGSLDPWKRTPLWLAVDSGDEDCVMLLLEHEDFNAQDSEKVSVFHQAVKKQHVHIINLLLGKRTKTNNQEGALPVNLEPVQSTMRPNILMLSDQEQSHVVSGPFSNKAKLDIDTIDADGETPLLRAVINESEEVVDLLLKELLNERGLSFQGVDENGDSELGRAADLGNREIVKALLEAGADTEKQNNDGRTPFYWAAFHDHEDIAKLLLAKGCNVTKADVYGESPFQAAVLHGSVSVVKLLLETTESSKKNSKNTKIRPPKTRSTIDLDGMMASGETALHLAAFMGHDNVIEVLLAHKANPMTLNRQGSTPLHIATEKKDFVSWKLLLPKMDSVAVEAKNNDGNSVLHLACRIGNISMIEGLLARISAKSSPISRDIILEKNASNETALSIAVQEEDCDILELLISHEADVKYVDEDGRNWATLEELSHDITATGKLLSIEENLKNTKDRIKVSNWGARHGNKLLVENLIDAESREKNTGQVSNLAAQALKWAATGGEEEIIEMLFGRCLPEDATSFAEELMKVAPEAIQTAARNGHERAVQKVIGWLIENDEDYSRGEQPLQNETWTPLHWAVNYKPHRDLEMDELESLDIIRNMIMRGSNSYPATKLADDLRTKSEEPESLFYEKILALLESPLRAKRKPLQLVDPSQGHASGHDNVCTRFDTNIVDFYTSGKGFCTLERKSPVNHIIYDKEGGPAKVMKSAMQAWELGSIGLEHRFRWIHLPANNLIWAKDLMTRIAFESRLSAMDYTEMHDFVDLNTREHKGRPQSRFMYPALTFESNEFQSGEGANIPRLRAEAKKNKRKENPRSKPPMAPQREELSRPLMEPSNQSITVFDYIKPEMRSVESKLHADKQIAPTERMSQKSEFQSGMKNKPDGKTEEKTKPIEKKTTSHLQGSKLLLSLPFLTFQTVKSHRALRQAIRLAEVVENLKGSASGAIDEQKKAELRRDARYDILQEEIYEGLILLHDSGSLFFNPLDNITKMTVIDKMKMPDGNSWLQSLKEVHKRIRRSPFSEFPDSLEWLERFLDAIEIVLRREDNSSTYQHLRKQEALMEYYIKPHDEEGLHASRTLDQYYYSSLADTSRRDVDQVSRRYQARRVAERSQTSSKVRTKSLSRRDRVMKIRDTRNFLEKHIKKDKSPVDDSRMNEEIGWVDDPEAKIAMVDQLWLWIIDDGKNKTVISCFPRGWDSETEEGARMDLLDRIRNHIHEESRPSISSVYHLAIMITSFCISYIEDCKANLDGCQDSFLHMFAGSIGIVTDEEVKCFEAFKTDLDKSRRNNDANNDTVKPELDIIKEIKLLEEVKDIRDELNILRSILGDQKSLLNKLLDLVAGQQRGKKMVETDPVLNYYSERSDINMRIKKVKKMDADAATTYASINHLLDLKQKHANLSEAFQAREQAEQTTKQGRTIMVFTIVTIIFLPLSFFTSLYALNIESFSHILDGDNWIYQDKWIFPRIFGTSAAIGAPMIWLAIYINTFLDMYTTHIRPIGSRDWWFNLRNQLESSFKKKSADVGASEVHRTVTPSQIESQPVLHYELESEGKYGR